MNQEYDLHFAELLEREAGKVERARVAGQSFESVFKEVWAGYAPVLRYVAIPRWSTDRSCFDTLVQALRHFAQERRARTSLK